MNAKLCCCLALLGTTAALAGCAESTGYQTRGTGKEAVEVVSRWKTTEPSFGTSPTRNVRSADESGTIGHSAGLVGLYGELESNWTGTETEDALDGSSNVSQVTFATEGACADPDIDLDGQSMVFSSTQHRDTADIYLKAVAGRTLTQLTTDPADDIMPTFHPSGTRIAFASNRSGNWDIYVMSTDGGQPMKVTDEPDPELHPSWSPDGEKLVYCKMGSKSGRWELWVVDLAHAGVRRFLEYGLFPQWCPDIARGKILFQRARERGSRYFSIWTVDYFNGDSMHPTEIIAASNAAVINPGWSPDGSRLVFVTVVEPGDNSSDNAVELSDIWIANLDGSGRTNLTNGRYANYQPVWGRDGRVYFVSNRTGADNVWSVTTSRAMDAIELQPARITTVLPGRDPEQRVGQP